MKLLTFSLFIFTFSFAANAASTNWATIQTCAADADASPGLASAANYTAYCITAAAATSYLGGTTVDAIGNYLTAHFAAAKTALAGDTTALALTGVSYGGPSGDQYDFTAYGATGYTSTDYLGIVLYESGDDREFRVFAAGSAELVGTALVFDETDTARASSIGTWTAVPEPTSGLLVLMGLAALALKRSARS